MSKTTLFLICFLGFCMPQLWSQVGIGTTNPNASTALHIDVENKGILIPQVDLTSNTDNTTITTGNVESLMVYNTSTNTTMSPGYYYWQNNQWRKMTTQDALPKSFLKVRNSSSVTLGLALLQDYRLARFNEKDFDLNDEYNTTEGAFTAKQDGIYHISFQADSNGLISAAEFGVGIFKESDDTITLEAEERYLSININLIGLLQLDVSPPVRSVETLVQLNAGDKIFFGVKAPAVFVSLLANSQTVASIHQVK